MERILWFTAEWCGPCKKMKPVVARIETESPTYKFVQFDIDDPENASTLQRYGVHSVPTFIRVDDDFTEVARVTGAHPPTKFRRDLGLEA